MTSSLLPAVLSPMLATLGGEPFDSPDFRFEVKWDGIRCLAFLESSTRLASRRSNDITGRYPELYGLHETVSGQPAVLDGEIVVLSGGAPDFGLLLARHQLTRPDRIRASAAAHPATFVAFDLLYWKGRNVMGYPLCRRQELLAETVAETGNLVLSRPVDELGVAFARAVFARGLEGVMAKRRDSPYLPGKRSRHWLKLKRPRTLHAVIAGYSERVDREGVGSVVVGLYDGEGALHLTGQAGVSLPHQSARELAALLASLKRESPEAFTGCGGFRPTVHWVEPRLACRLEYLERTAAGHLRHAVFRGLSERPPAACRLDQLEAGRPPGGEFA